MCPDSSKSSKKSLILTSQKDIVVAIFAKYPRPGKVKTRLAKGEIAGIGQLNLEQCSALYRSFLQDYIHRLTHEWSESDLPIQFRFCLRPSPDFARFQEEFGSSQITAFQEPNYEGRPAQDIGQAMGFTIRHLLDQGYKKVILLSSDLPHLPTSCLKEAFQALTDVPLVLGNDGGGCYLVGASQPAAVLETGTIAWSQDTDFAAICQAQQRQGLTFHELEQRIEDIDRADALERLIARLREDSFLRVSLPHTNRLLGQWQAG